MQHILTASNSEVLRLLGSRACVRLGLTRHVVTSGREALEAARQLLPRLIVLDVDMPDIDGYAVCRAIKADPALGACRVMLVTSGIIGRAKLEALSGAGCDDVIVMPAPGIEFFSHVADLLGVPRRRTRRVAVELLVRLDAGPQVIEGRVENLSLSGAKVHLQQPLPLLGAVRVRLARDGGGAAAIMDARVVWRRDDGREAGLEFSCVGAEARRYLETLVLWDVSEEDGLTRVYLDGDIVETTDFLALPDRLAGTVDFDAGGVRYINSQGTRLWQAFLQDLREVEEYTFSRCSVAFMTQASLVPTFVGRGRVVSFMAPYHCDGCHRDEVRLLQTATLVDEGGARAAPSFRCPNCGQSLALDEVAERYFAFLDRP
jgi:CheY-like chemotaxis protein